MGVNFLIVDDSANIRAFIKKTLGMTEIDIAEVREASNGEEGFSVMQEYKVDVLLTDINMPKMDGLEFVKKVREVEGFNKVVIIIISTEGSREMILKSVKCGANGYLKKPFGPEEVMEILKEKVEK